MKKNNIFWGIVFVLLAVLVIVSELGLIEGVGFWTIVFSVIFIAALFRGIWKLDATEILFSIAFLCIVWDDVLGIQKITPWPVLLAAALGSIGCHMIFSGGKKEYYAKKYYAMHSGNGETIEQESGEEVRCSVSFGTNVKYIHSENLKNIYVSASFGSASIYLDHAQAPSGEVLINIDSSFSGIELFLPKDWYVENHMRNTFAGVDIGKGSTGVNAVKVVLIGSANFAGVTVSYI